MLMLVTIFRSLEIYIVRVAIIQSLNRSVKKNFASSWMSVYSIYSLFKNYRVLFLCWNKVALCSRSELHVILLCVRVHFQLLLQLLWKTRRANWRFISGLLFFESLNLFFSYEKATHCQVYIPIWIKLISNSIQN